MQTFDIIAIGGGPASFFACIRAAELNPKLKIAIIEQSKDVLNKVKISGGGRCNVTNACFIPEELIENYPRGNPELLGPFHTFFTADTIEWFEKRGVKLKIESDNRVFPNSNNSMSIVNCLLNEAKKLNIQIIYNQSIHNFYYKEGYWILNSKTTEHSTKKLFIGTGSSYKIWDLLKKNGHTINLPIPSLFTFNIKNHLLTDLQGIGFKQVEVKIAESNYSFIGPMLITHWGLSGPAILKLSALAARDLYSKNYIFEIHVNFINKTFNQVLGELLNFKSINSIKKINSHSLFDLPKRFWMNCTHFCNEKNWADLSNKDVEKLAQILTKSSFTVNGKSTNKDEFVTCGGVSLKEIDFKNFKSKLHNNLFLAGEVLDIDALTGGFNFQACWTGGYIAGTSMSQ